MAKLLLIDDEPEFGEALRDQLTDRGHEVRLLDDPQEALDLLADGGEPFDLILLDNKMPGLSGLEFLAAVRKRPFGIPVILMTSAHKDETVIQAMNLGAFGYVIKPLDEDALLDELGPEIDQALKITRPPPPVPLPTSADRPPEDESLIVGKSRPILEVLKKVGRFAQMDEPVLILGETGTGKDLLARAIHTNSRRRNRPFVPMNCAAFNENLLDDELFGHEPNAFTGADKLRKGLFEHADGGTLFLDEVGDMAATLQAKLLRVLENREVVRLGSNEPIRVDVRVLAATHRDLKALVREGQFREDLVYRLEGLAIHLPPLRERGGDIDLLADRFLARLFGGGSSMPALHPAARQVLRDHPWPGNIRQLQKVLCRAVGLCRGAQIVPEDLDFGELDDPPQTACPPPCGQDAAEAGLRAAVAWAWQSGEADLWPLLQGRLERELLRTALLQPGLSQVQLAKRLGMARNTLRARIEAYGLQPPPPGT